MHSLNQFVQKFTTSIVLCSRILSAFQIPTTAVSAQGQDDGIVREFNSDTGKVTLLTGANDQPVAMLSFYPMAAVVLADSPVRSLQDLVALSHKQALSAGSGGNGTPQHLVLEMFKGATGAKILHVPYKGGAPALAGRGRYRPAR
jgi:hypothetical protein